MEIQSPSQRDGSVHSSPATPAQGADHPGNDGWLPISWADRRAASITDASKGRNSFWVVLGRGIAFGGSCGAVRVRDQWGDEGFVVQQYPGSVAGMTSAKLSDYAEVG